MRTEQPDLFDLTGYDAGPVDPVFPAVAAVDIGMLDDEALIAAIPNASRAACEALTTEAVRRGLASAVPALETLCRRFKGFGLHTLMAEQAAALQALAAIGGPAAARAVTRIVEDAIVADPGLPVAMNVAAALGCRLSAATAARLLRHADPDVRAQAARCAPATGDAAAVLSDLLEDLHPRVARAAAVALGRAGRTGARPALLRLLGNQPSAELIDAIAAVADETVIVLLGRVARTHTDLATVAIEALRDIDDERAAAIADRLAGTA